MELPADDLGRAASFYEAVFGWSHLRLPFEYILFDATGRAIDPSDCDGGISPRNEFVKAPVPIISVESIETVAERVVANGGQLLNDKEAVGEFGYSMYVRDCEGTVICLWQGSDAKPVGALKGAP